MGPLEEFIHMLTEFKMHQFKYWHDAQKLTKIAYKYYCCKFEDNSLIIVQGICQSTQCILM